MRSINPKCTNSESFKYSVLISLPYYDLKDHPERINQLKRQENKYIFKTIDYVAFENNNPSISLNVYDEYGELLDRATNSTNNKAYILKINKHRYHALKPNKEKYIILKDTLKPFTHKELTDFILNKVSH